MEFFEKDLEQVVCETDPQILENKGLRISGKRFRKLKIGKYGVADLVTVERFNEKEKSFLLVKVFEFKKDTIGISAFLQAIGYAKGIQEYLSFRDFGCEVVYQVVLVGRTIDVKSTFCYLTDLLPFDSFLSDDRFLTCYTYKLSIDGLTFEEQSDFSLTENGFKK